MATKIQINSLAALERLIGGDNEFEIEIRNSVVQAFTQKHLKGIAAQQAEHFRAVAAATTEAAINKHIGSRTSSWGSGYTLKADVEKEIENSVKYKVGEAIAKAVADNVNAKDLEKLINAMVDKRLNVAIADEVNHQVKQKIAVLMKGLSA